METAKRSRSNLVLGIWIIAVFVSVIGVIFSAKPLAFLFGELLGSAIATASAFHIYHVLDEALDLDSKYAAGHMRKGAMLRSVIMLGALAAGYLFRAWVSPVGIFLGLMGLKFAAYLHPFLEKIRKRMKERSE